MIKQQMIVLSKDGNDNVQQTTLDIDPNPTLSYEIIDQAARSLISLSSNTYVDTHIIRTISVNEELD